MDKKITDYMDAKSFVLYLYNERGIGINGVGTTINIVKDMNLYDLLKEYIGDLGWDIDDADYQERYTDFIHYIGDRSMGSYIRHAPDTIGDSNWRVIEFDELQFRRVHNQYVLTTKMYNKFSISKDDKILSFRELDNELTNLYLSLDF